MNSKEFVDRKFFNVGTHTPPKNHPNIVIRYPIDARPISKNVLIKPKRHPVILTYCNTPSNTPR
jgi:hypothetical protein